MKTSYDTATKNEKIIEKRVNYDLRWGNCHDGGKRLLNDFGKGRYDLDLSVKSLFDFSRITAITRTFIQFTLYLQIHVHEGVCKLTLSNTMLWFIRAPAQSEFTCSKLTIETLEQGVKYVQS